MGSNHFVNFFQYNTPRDRNSLAISLIEKKRGGKKEEERENLLGIFSTQIFSTMTADLSGFIWFPLANLIDTQLARTREITSVFCTSTPNPLSAERPEVARGIGGGDRRKKNFLEMIIIYADDRCRYVIEQTRFALN